MSFTVDQVTVISESVPGTIDRPQLIVTQFTNPASRLRIMLVDDDAMITSMLAMMLVDMGHDICAIETSEAGAVRGASRTQPDLMIVDAILGKGSGVHAVETIRQTRLTPYILTSGTRIDTAHAEAVLLAKPFREIDLHRAIQHATSPDRR